MTAESIARQFIAMLEQTGFLAQLGQSINYGHKILLSSSAGIDHGTLVVYVGKKGSRYVTNELCNTSDEILATINTAWTRAVDPHDRAEASPSSNSVTVPPSEPGTIELWVDGACLQQPDRLKFGWACVIRQDGKELYRHQSSRILPYMAPHRNVAAELQAVVHGLDTCRLMGLSAVTVYFDYQGIGSWATGAWKANTQTTQEYAHFIAACPLTLTWQKVPAHAGVPMNELVDQLATQAAMHSTESFPYTTT